MMRCLLGLIVMVCAVSAPAETGIRHSFLVTGARTCIIDEAGQVAWSYPHGTRDGYVLPNGHVLLALSKSKQYPGGAAIEVTRSGQVVFEYQGAQQELQAVQPLDNGRILIVEGGTEPKLMELNRDGTVAVEFPLACQKKNVHMQTRMARKLADGTYLAPHLLDFAVKQYDAQGKVLRVIDTTAPGDPNPGRSPPSACQTATRSAG